MMLIREACGSVFFTVRLIIGVAFMDSWNGLCRWCQRVCGSLHVDVPHAVDRDANQSSD